MHTISGVISFAIGILLCIPVNAADWNRFRGPMGCGSTPDYSAALTWSESENLKWKTPLPGPGSSSPIVSGERIFVTCYSGQGAALNRHLVSINRVDGKIVWVRTVEADQPEDDYQGYLTEHGYASNTPVADGVAVYVFFGKTGVLAYDFDGEKLWQVHVGTESSNRRWGSASSLVVCDDKVIVNAAEESRSLIALDRLTGKERWNTPAEALELAYGTPTPVELSDGRVELVIGVPGEVWGLNPNTGKLNWLAATSLTGNVSPSVVAGDGVVYVFGGYRSSGSHAIRLGGKRDVTDSHMLWSSRNSSYVATPLLYEGHLYWVDDRGQAFCADASTGDLVYRKRLRGLSSGGRPFYASPILVGNRLYVVSRWDGTFVFAAKPEFEQLAVNKFESDESDFSGTPAVSDGDLLIRSGKFLYCIVKESSGEQR